MSKRIQKFDEDSSLFSEINQSFQPDSSLFDKIKLGVLITFFVILCIALIVMNLKLSERQQTIKDLKAQVNSKQQRIAVLYTEIQIKRKNQNMFRVILNDSVIQFNQDSHIYNQTLMQLLKQFYAQNKAQSIGDFGCGKCEYIIQLAQEGYNAKGYDGTPYTNDSLIKEIDLSQQIDLNETFDYVQTFQVGEHIYSDFEQNFIKNIAHHAKKGIVMSWSIVGQGGFLHVNNRDSDYLIPKIQSYGFRLNQTQSQLFRSMFDNYFNKSLLVFDKI